MGRAAKIAKKILPDSFIDLMAVLIKHRLKHGAFPNIKSPHTFSEKIAHRNLSDRHPILTEFADKYAVRKYVAAKIGADILPRLYYATKNPSDIPFDSLPHKFVVKPTHGSGWVRLVADKSKLDTLELIKTCNGWLSQSFYQITREWVYKNIEPRIIIEEFINEGDDSPNDYKLFVFDGKAELIQVDSGRFADHRRDFYDREWNKVDVTLTFPPSVGIARPARLDEIIGAAEKLCEGMDFIRADFYATDDKIFFGELTTTPGNGLEIFNPPEFDLKLGALWKR